MDLVNTGIKVPHVYNEIYCCGPVSLPEVLGPHVETLHTHKMGIQICIRVQKRAYG